jgi:hypothetical protein
MDKNKNKEFGYPGRGRGGTGRGGTGRGGTGRGGAGRGGAGRGRGAGLPTARELKQRYMDQRIEDWAVEGKTLFKAIDEAKLFSDPSDERIVFLLAKGIEHASVKQKLPLPSKNGKKISRKSSYVGQHHQGSEGCRLRTTCTDS